MAYFLGIIIYISSLLDNNIVSSYYLFYIYIFQAFSIIVMANTHLFYLLYKNMYSVLFYSFSIFKYRYSSSC